MKRLALALGLLLSLGAGARELEVLPIVGPVTRDSAVLWFQTKKPRTIALVCSGPGAPSSLEVDTGEDAIGTVRLTGLKPGSHYEVRVVEPANWLPISFDTQPARPGDFHFTFGSCAYINDPKYPRGEDGGEYEIYTAIAAEHPAFMLWLGDNVYYRHGDWTSEELMRARFRTDRWRLESWWPVFAGAANYAIWDDHDFGPNNSESNFPLRDTALKVFRSVWPGGAYGQEAIEGAFYRFSWEDVDFFMLDDRYYRGGGVMYGRAQMEWLRQGLSASQASFKVIVGGSQMLNPFVSDEAWAEYPQERQDFLDWLKFAQIPGVVFLSGDRHSAELMRVDIGYPLYDFTSSPLNSSLHKQSAQELANPFRVPGTSFDQKRNYGVARVSGPVGDRMLIFECRDSAGERIWSQVIRQRELRFQAIRANRSSRLTSKPCRNSSAVLLAGPGLGFFRRLGSGRGRSRRSPARSTSPGRRPLRLAS